MTEALHRAAPDPGGNGQSATDPHGLVESIVYGPAPSRRYGRALGVNLLPRDRKTCTLSCVYCQLGHAKAVLTDAAWPRPEEVHAALLAGPADEVDTIVLSGNGEPTLHPRFPQVVDAICAARDLVRPRVPIVCLTSGTELHRAEVSGALRRLDETAVKIDAGRCRTLLRIARPSSSYCPSWLALLVRSYRGAVVQSCFFDGPVSNARDEDVDAWIETVTTAAPSRVDVYTVSRKTPSANVRPLPLERLARIAERLRAASTIPVRVAA
jgi:wyosine [tRNA(Phe)-imidazoG37] synthetase (radical SAM superfamily)